MKRKTAVPVREETRSDAKGAVQGKKALPFEQGIGVLEQIIQRLESGELPLEEALKAFEEGVGLVRALHDKLTAAEQRVEVLSRGEGGSLELRTAEEDEL